MLSPCKTSLKQEDLQISSETHFKVKNKNVGGKKYRAAILMHVAFAENH